MHQSRVIVVKNKMVLPLYKCKDRGSQSNPSNYPPLTNDRWSDGGHPELPSFTFLEIQQANLNASIWICFPQIDRTSTYFRCPQIHRLQDNLAPTGIVSRRGPLHACNPKTRIAFVCWKPILWFEFGRGLWFWSWLRIGMILVVDLTHDLRFWWQIHGSIELVIFKCHDWLVESAWQCPIVAIQRYW